MRQPRPLRSNLAYRCMECGKQIEKGAAHLRGNLRTVRAWCRKCWGSEVEEKQAG